MFGQSISIILLLVILLATSIQSIPMRQKRDVVDDEKMPNRITPLEIFDPYEDVEDIDENDKEMTTSTTTQSSGDILSKVLMNNLDESVRPIEM